jgi:hypothetical protein
LCRKKIKEIFLVTKYDIQVTATSKNGAVHNVMTVILNVLRTTAAFSWRG